MTVILITAGTVCFFILEYSDPETFGNMSAGEKLMAAGFHSVSTRTAGFATVPSADLRMAQNLLRVF